MTEVELFSEKALEAIDSCKFLSKQDETALSEMKAELQNTFEKAPKWRNETLARVSVLGDLTHPDPASKYWQAVTEQNVHFSNLVTLSFDYRRNNITLKKLNRELEREEDDLKREWIKIEIEEALFKKKNFENDAKNRMKEIKIWSKLKGEYDDGSFDTEDNETDQLLSLTKQSLNRYISATADGVKCQPDEMKNISSLALTGLKRCEEVGILSEVLKDYTPDILNKIMPSLGYSLISEKETV